MRQFQLERVRFEGKDYRRCTLSVDETAGKVEITYQKRKRFSSEPVSLTRFGFDSTTRSSRISASVVMGNVEMVALSPEDASSIESLLGAPRKAAREQALEFLATCEERARDFLRLRGETLAFLSILRSDPAEGRFQLYYSTKAQPEAALKEYLKSRGEVLTGALDRLDSALADLGQKTGPKVPERVYAVTYLAGLIQDNLFEKGEPDLRAEGFVSELGIREGALSPPFEEVPVKLLAAAHESTAALMD
jgi:hypothetical protein